MSKLEADISRQVESLGRTINRLARPIVAIAMVRDEADIIERFVRHANSWADAIFIVDHASCDGTPVILRQLVDEGLPLRVIGDDASGRHQPDRLTLLAKSAAMQLNAHAIVPLDADEFIIDERGCNPRSLLLAVSPDAVISVAWRSYVPTPLDEPSEVDVLKRINNRLAIEAGVTKVIIGGSLPREPSFRLAHGSHSVFSKTSNIAPTLNPTFYLCHFPVRSAGQITAKVLLGQLSGSLATERPSWAQEHYRWLRETCAVHSYMSPAELQTVAERYALSKVADPPGLVFDPVKDASGLLRYTFQTSVDPAFRIEQFARRILLAKNGDAPTALRSLISDENVLLRAERDEALALLQLAEAGSLRAERDEALAQLQLAEAECRRMRASRAVRFSTAVRRIFNRRH